MWQRPLFISAILLCQACNDRQTPMSQLSKDTLQASGTSVERFTLHNDRISVSTIPALGGKITSLRLLDGREFLSRSKRPYVQRSYGMSYGDTEFDGIDECFPSLATSAYPAEPWQDITIPDHGEICQLAWQVDHADAHRISCSIQGKALPYTISRSIRIDNTSVTLAYTLRNTGDHSLHWMYAFHPLFHGESNCQLLFPDDTPISVALSSGGHLGPKQEHTWGNFKRADGSIFKDQQYQAGTKQYYKYFAGPLKNGSVSLQYIDGSHLTMTWPEKLFPYAAVWCSQGAVGGLEHIAAEPSNTAHDALKDAHAAQQSLELAAQQSIEWQIRFTLAE